MQTAEKSGTAVAPVNKLKGYLAHPATRQMFEDVLKENAGAFIASILDLYQSDGYLQKCDPSAVVRECMKAASLKLPINKNLGFAYIVPYKNVPQFQMGWKGYVQLGLRTGQFKHLHADCVFEGENVVPHRLNGTCQISGTPTSDKTIGYFAHMELLNGFEKTIYITIQRAMMHGQRYSQAYQYDLRENKKTSLWSTDPDAAGRKTAIKMLSKFFPMSVEMARMLDEIDEQIIDGEILENANQGPVIEITSVEPKDGVCAKCGQTGVPLSKGDEGLLCETCFTGAKGSGNGEQKKPSW